MLHTDDKVLKCRNIYCEHSTRKYTCKKCKFLGIGGSGLCEHLKQRYTCKECKFFGIGGKGLCDHYKCKDYCAQCRWIKINRSSISNISSGFDRGQRPITAIEININKEQNKETEGIKTKKRERNDNLIARNIKRIKREKSIG